MYCLKRLITVLNKEAQIGSRYVNICVSLIFPSKSGTHNKEQTNIFEMIKHVIPYNFVC